MEDKLNTAQEAAIGFAKRLRPQDLAQIVDFDSRVVILQPFTNDAGQLEQAIRRTSAGGSTSLYNAIYIALKELKKVRAKTSDDVRRQAIVVLSDGEDTSSLVPFEEVLDLAKRSETAIYAIGLRGRDPAPLADSGGGVRAAAARQETGGRAFFPTAVTELPAIYTQIADELSSQYTVGYTSRNAKRDGAWRRIVVRIERTDSPPHQAGVLRPDHDYRALHELGPRSRSTRRRRRSTPALRRRQPASDGPRPRCSSSRRSRTPSSSACRRWTLAMCRSRRQTRRSRRSSGCSRSPISTSR